MTAINLTASDGVAELVLAEPARRNSLDDEFWRELPVRLDEIAADPEIRAVVLAAEGDHFCSGIDLDFVGRVLATDSVDEGRARDRANQNIRRLQDAFLQLERCRVPVIAAVQGACIGAGLELACTADIRVCSRDAFFQLMEVRVGLVADLGGLQRLARQVPMGVARELAYTGRRFAADEAHAWGFVSRVTDSAADATAAAWEIAGQIAANSPLAVRYIKEAFVAEDSLRIERELRQAAIANTAFGQDAAAAFAAVRSGNRLEYADLDVRPQAGRKERS
jgi:enoyl-CoA hydratase/carnithine racemase